MLTPKDEGSNYDLYKDRLYESICQTEHIVEGKSMTFEMETTVGSIYCCLDDVYICHCSPCWEQREDEPQKIFIYRYMQGEDDYEFFHEIPISLRFDLEADAATYLTLMEKFIKEKVLEVHNDSIRKKDQSDES